MPIYTRNQTCNSCDTYGWRTPSDGDVYIVAFSAWTGVRRPAPCGKTLMIHSIYVYTQSTSLLNRMHVEFVS